MWQAVRARIVGSGMEPATTTRELSGDKAQRIIEAMRASRSLLTQPGPA